MEKIKDWDGLTELHQYTLENVLKGLLVKQEIQKCISTKNPSLYIGSSGYVRINIDLRGSSNAKDIIRELTKKLKTTFAKEKGMNGFLRYKTIVNTIPVICNTAQCFFGGAPHIIQHPRTKAVCPVMAK